MLLGKALIFLHDIINFKNIVDERKEKQDHIPHAHTPCSLLLANDAHKEWQCMYSET